MNIRFLDRLIAALAGLVILFLGVCLLILALGIFPFQMEATVQGLLRGDFATPLQRVLAVGIGVLLAALGVHSLSLLLRRRKDRGFILQHTEYGDMSISMHAMENMVKRCVEPHEELKATHTRIHRSREGVVVALRISLANGVNIPLTVNALQKQIKHYITSCSGVDVKEVRVMVETGNQTAKNTGMLAPDLQAADACVAAHSSPLPEAFPGVAPPIGFGEEKAVKEPFHQRIFRQEEPAPVVREVQAAYEIHPEPQAEAAPQAYAEAPEAEAAVETAQEVTEETAQKASEEASQEAEEAASGQPGIEPAQDSRLEDNLDGDEKENE